MTRILPKWPLVLAALASGPAALAQVAVDRGALEQLRPNAPAAAPDAPTAAPRAPRPSAPRQPTNVRPAAQASAKPAAKPAKPPPKRTQATLAPAPPPPAILAPPPAAPAVPVVLPTIPMQPDAPGSAAKIVGGLRVTFGHEAADLNPTTVAALRSVARTIGADPNSSMNVYAYADGPADDPSTPRRLSLSRALAVRAVLMSEGIASTRIYVRALGATTPPGVAEGPLDRVDVTQVGIAPAR